MKGTEKQIKWAQDIIKETSEYIDRQIARLERLCVSFNNDSEYAICLKYWNQCKADFEAVIEKTETAGEIINAYKNNVFRPYRLEEWVMVQTRREHDRVIEEKMAAIKAEKEAEEVEEADTAEEAEEHVEEVVDKEAEDAEALKEVINKVEKLAKNHGMFLFKGREKAGTYILIENPHRECDYDTPSIRECFKALAVRHTDVMTHPFDEIAVYEVIWEITGNDEDDANNAEWDAPYRIDRQSGIYEVFGQPARFKK